MKITRTTKVNKNTLTSYSQWTPLNKRAAASILQYIASQLRAGASANNVLGKVTTEKKSRSLSLMISPASAAKKKTGYSIVTVVTDRYLPRATSTATTIGSRKKTAKTVRKPAKRKTATLTGPRF